MASGGAAGAAATATPAASAAAGSNPFWSASSWYFEANNQEIANGSYQLTSSQKTFSIPLNSKGYFRKYRCVVRSSGAVGGTPQNDAPENLFQQITFQVPSGSEFFQVMTGWDHRNMNAFGRPWEGDPTQYYDYGRNINPSFQLTLPPEIRSTAGALANMDARRSYLVAGTLATTTQLNGSSASTAPTITFASGIDVWAQVDDKDLQGTSNEQVPPGYSMQVYRRKVSNNTLNGAGASNTIDARTITGNLQRLITLVLRDSNGNRQDYFADPINWKLDSKTLGNWTFAGLQGMFNDFYGTDILQRPTGVYLWPRFHNPVTGVGQGWNDTNGATSEVWTASTIATGTNLPGTVEIQIEDVVPLASMPASLMNI
jgi:hypothetical protein